MQTTIEGHESIDVPIDRLRAFMEDNSNIAKCIPDSKNFTNIDNSNFTIEIEAGISVVHGTFKFAGNASHDGDTYTYSLKGKGLGSDVSITITISLSALGNESTGVAWKTSAQFGGIISGVSEPIIKSVTNQKVAEIIDKLKKELASA
jgi:carbon monoxide dehydrogenase subunit G